MTTTKLIEIKELYCQYIKKSNEERLHAGELLRKAGNELLTFDKTRIKLNEALDRNFLLRKIAGDLIRQVENMGWTKQYDCAPMLIDYTYLAFNLAYEYCEKKADRRLLPFLAHVMYYENYNEDKFELRRLKGIYEHSLKLEKKYIDKLLISERPGYDTDIWGF